MSYILEALKKSELERQHGAAALHYSLLPVVMEEAMGRPRRWPYHVLGAGLLINAAVIYVWPSWSLMAPLQSETDAKRAAHAQAAPVSARSMSEPAPSTAHDEAPPVAIRAAPRELVALRAPATIAHRAPLVARVPAVTRSIPRNERTAAREEPELLSIPMQETSPATTPERNATLSSAQKPKPGISGNAPSAKSVSAAGETAPAAQGELPPIAIGGFIREGASGMVAVNDRLVREGDEVMPGLRVEKIQNDSVVFNYKGRRFVR